jgi:hypothetical protein
MRTYYESQRKKTYLVRELVNFDASSDPTNTPRAVN